MVPLAIAGIAGGAYYFYTQGQKSPVAAATVQPSNPVLTKPDEWIDFKVGPTFPNSPCSRRIDHGTSGRMEEFALDQWVDGSYRKSRQ